MSAVTVSRLPVFGLQTWLFTCVVGVGAGPVQEVHAIARGCKNTTKQIRAIKKERGLTIRANERIEMPPTATDCGNRTRIGMPINIPGEYKSIEEQLKRGY
jgi:hypothetical protein